MVMMSLTYLLLICLVASVNYSMNLITVSYPSLQDLKLGKIYIYYFILSITGELVCKPSIYSYRCPLLASIVSDYLHLNHTHYDQLHQSPYF